MTIRSLKHILVLVSAAVAFATIPQATADLMIFTDRTSWESAVNEFTIENLECEIIGFLGPTPYTTGGGWELSSLAEPITIQVLYPGLVNGSSEIHFRDFGEMMSFAFPGGASRQAFGLDYDTAGEDWELKVDGETIAMLEGGQNGFIGVVSDTEAIPSFVLTSPAFAQGGISVDNLSAATESECTDDDGDGRVTICHIPPGNSDNAHTITVGARAVPAHLAHGDSCGPCEEDDGFLLMTGESEVCSADVNGDGVVNAADLAILLGAWGPCE